MSEKDFASPSFRDKPDMSMIWLRHMDRTNQSSGQFAEAYNGYVRQQLRLLPLQMRKWVETESDKYIRLDKILVYKEEMGYQIGEENYPVVYNLKGDIGSSRDPKFPVKRLLGPIDWDDPNIEERVNVAEDDEDPIWEPVLHDESIPVRRLQGEIDWGDPNIISPKQEEVEYIDYEEFNRLILQASEMAGLSWKTESMNTEYGLYPDKEDLEEAKPTPLDDPKKNELPEQNPLHQKCWINYKGTPKLVTNFRGYACGIGDLEKPWFFSELGHRQKKQLPIVILITATQGEGKTYAGIRIAEIFDKRFDPDKQIVMDRRKILKLVSGRGGLKRNQVIIVDESQWGASAREWGKTEQIKLMKFLAAARFKGFIIIIVSLHRSMLDSIIRERIINFHIHMEERGRATVYQPRHARFDESSYPSRKGGLILQLPDYDACESSTCLTCDDNETCMTTRARYERNKTTFIEGEAEKDAQSEMKEAAGEMSEQELAALCIDYIENIDTNTKGFYNVDDIKFTLMEKYGLDISHRKATRVRAYLMKQKPPTRLLA